MLRNIINQVVEWGKEFLRLWGFNIPYTTAQVAEKLVQEFAEEQDFNARWEVIWNRALESRKRGFEAGLRDARRRFGEDDD